MRGAVGKPALLPAAIYEAMQTPARGADYAFGWSVVPRKWAGGNMLSHAGSNTMNTAACWLGPARGYGVLVCANQADLKRHVWTNEAAEAMLPLAQAECGGAGAFLISLKIQEGIPAAVAGSADGGRWRLPGVRNYPKRATRPWRRAWPWRC